MAFTIGPQAHQFTKRERAPRIELWFRIIHLADDKNNEISATVEQTVEVTLGPQNAFEFECIGRLTRRVPGSQVVSGALPKKPKTKKPSKGKRNQRNSSEPPKIVELLHTAAEWCRQLDSGEVASQAEIARRERISRARVTQVLALLRLAPGIRKQILAKPWLQDGKAISEQRLRRLVNKQPAEQRVVLTEILASAAELD